MIEQGMIEQGKRAPHENLGLRMLEMGDLASAKARLQGFQSSKK